MKLLVTGKTGQLGHDICKELEARGHEVIGMGSADMDITDADAVRKVLYANRPEIVIHCVAHTAVDNAEDEVETCRRVNVDGTENIARICRELDAVMLYLSTDYVFSGTDERPWKPEDEAEPLGVYGLTKYEGELAVKKYLKKYFIVRVSWIYGINGKNFVKTMLRLGEERGAVSVVNDQIVCRPTPGIWLFCLRIWQRVRNMARIMPRMKGFAAGMNLHVRFSGRLEWIMLL